MGASGSEWGADKERIGSGGWEQMATGSQKITVYSYIFTLFWGAEEERRGTNGERKWNIVGAA